MGSSARRRRDCDDRRRRRCGVRSRQALARRKRVGRVPRRAASEGSLYRCGRRELGARDTTARRPCRDVARPSRGCAARTRTRRAEPDAAEDEHYRPGSLLHGKTGPLLVAFLLSSDAQLADDLHELVHGNVANPTDDISWGAPGTLLAALAMHEWTGEARWMEAARESAVGLRARRGDDGLWRQDDDYRGLGTLHGAAGNTLALLRFDRDEALARDTAAVLARHASREDGLANWPGTPRAQLARPRDGRICLQWCT